MNARHTVIRRPEGRWQCTACRAAWLTPTGHQLAAQPCPGLPLAHGHPLEREHVVYPTWSKDACTPDNCADPDPTHSHGPDRLCDYSGCMRCVAHSCDCDVCQQNVTAPGLNVLHDPQEF